MPNSCFPIQQLKDAFIEAIGVTPDADWNNLQYGSTEGWDSIGHLLLLSEFDSRFNVVLTSSDLVHLDSFLKAKEIVEAHGIRFE